MLEYGDDVGDDPGQSWIFVPVVGFGPHDPTMGPPWTVLGPGRPWGRVWGPTSLANYSSSKTRSTFLALHFWDADNLLMNYFTC